MHAVVSLCDKPTTKAVKTLWAELANDFGVGHLAEVLPYPHVSYQIARHYDEDSPDEIWWSEWPIRQHRFLCRPVV